MSDKVVAGGDVIGLVMSDPGTEPQGTSGPSFSILKLHSMGGVLEFGLARDVIF